jgi:hypothetical protein
VGLLLLASLVILTGCSGSRGDANSVTGKVKLQPGDKPVSGIVHFVYADGKEVTAPTGEGGTYKIIAAPPGQVKILVKAMPGATIVAPKGGEMPGKDAPVSTSAGGVPPPQKYGVSQSSDLSYEVKAGKQTHDIELKE